MTHAMWNIIVKNENDEIKEDFTLKNTWNKRAELMTLGTHHNYGSSYSTGMVISLLKKIGDVQYPYEGAVIDRHVEGDYAGVLGASVFVSTGSLTEESNGVWSRSSNFGPSWEYSGTYKGIYLIKRPSGLNINTKIINGSNSYNHHKGTIYSIIRFPNDLVLTSTDRVYWSLKIYFTNSNMNVER